MRVFLTFCDGTIDSAHVQEALGYTSFTGGRYAATVKSSAHTIGYATNLSAYTSKKQQKAHLAMDKKGSLVPKKPSLLANLYPRKDTTNKSRVLV